MNLAKKEIVQEFEQPAHVMNRNPAVVMHGDKVVMSNWHKAGQTEVSLFKLAPHDNNGRGKLCLLATNKVDGDVLKLSLDARHFVTWSDNAPCPGEMVPNEEPSDYLAVYETANGSLCRVVHFEDCNSDWWAGAALHWPLLAVRAEDAIEIYNLETPQEANSKPVHRLLVGYEGYPSFEINTGGYLIIAQKAEPTIMEHDVTKFGACRFYIYTQTDLLKCDDVDKEYKAQEQDLGEEDGDGADEENEEDHEDDSEAAPPKKEVHHVEVVQRDLTLNSFRYFLTRFTVDSSRIVLLDDNNQLVITDFWKC